MTTPGRQAAIEAVRDEKRQEALSYFNPEARVPFIEAWNTGFDAGVAAYEQALAEQPREERSNLADVFGRATDARIGLRRTDVQRRQDEAEQSEQPTAQAHTNGDCLPDCAFCAEQPRGEEEREEYPPMNFEAAMEIAEPMDYTPIGQREIAERDAWIRTFNRLCALVAKHIDSKTPGMRFTHFADEADEALHAGYRRVVKDAPALAAYREDE